MMTPSRASRVLVAVLVCTGLAVAHGAAARAAESEIESGPNFQLPADLPAGASEQYAKAVKAYEAARDAQAGQTEKVAQAIRDWKRVKELAPKLPQAGYYLGILYQFTKEFEKARQVLRLACDLNPKFHQAFVELGDVYMWMKQPEKATVEYDRALAVKAEFSHGFLHRGFLKLRTGDLPGALADFELAKKHGKEDSPERPAIDRGIQFAKGEVEGPGWATTYTRETEHYRVLTPVSQQFADEIGKHAELIYKTYTKIFPRAAKEKRKFPIIVHGSREDYHASGGPQSAGGHYEPLLRKLVLFQYADDRDTKLVLYHEGFHQFLHDYLEDAPQWFDEGLGDFFGPSRYVEGGKKGGAEGMEIRPNPWRLKRIQEAIRAGRVRPWRTLMLMSQAELYDPEWAGIHYAQSWSIIYFLVRGGAPAGSQAGPYFKLLQEYFKVLRRGEGQESAFEAAFGRADLSRMESEWKQFTLGIEAGSSE